MSTELPQVGLTIRERGDDRLYFLDGPHPEGIDPRRVGAKAANLMRMAEAGLPVPAGCVLSTEICADYHARGDRLDPNLHGLLRQGLEHLEERTGRHFGATRHPLLVAVRSGAPLSMPGMLDTILNVGLSDVTVPGLLRSTGNPTFVWDSYRRLIQSYAEVVAGCPPTPFAVAVDDCLRREGVPDISELDVEARRILVEHFRDLFRSLASQPFPQDPWDQLYGAVEAVLRSWDAPRAMEYRRLEGLDHLLGTAVTVQAMVFGNLGQKSGSGVAFTRDPAEGRNRLYVDFVLNGQGEDIVAGRQGTGDPGPVLAAIPGLETELQTVRGRLEDLFGDAQDFEFTVEDGNFWLLQTRTAQRTPWAALQVACDLVAEGRIEPNVALERLRGYDLDSISRLQLADDVKARPIASATSAGIGVATGPIVLEVDAARRRAQDGEPAILVREHASTEDIAGLAACRGLLTATGARTSHAAVVARQLGVVCLVGCADLHVDSQGGRIRIGDCLLDAGEQITIDGVTGLIYVGAPRLVERRPTELISRVRAWEQQLP